MLLPYLRLVDLRCRARFMPKLVLGESDCRGVLVVMRSHRGRRRRQDANSVSIWTAVQAISTKLSHGGTWSRTWGRLACEYASLVFSPLLQEDPLSNPIGLRDWMRDVGFSPIVRAVLDPADARRQQGSQTQLKKLCPPHSNARFRTDHGKVRAKQEGVSQRSPAIHSRVNVEEHSASLCDGAART